MTGSGYRWCIHCLTVALLMATSTAAYAASGFIASSRISGDSESSDIKIRFNCQVEYLQHEPMGSGDQLRIYLDPTAICNGVSPTVAESRGRYRPANSDTARLLDFEYDGSSAAGPILTFNFNEVVSYSIDSPSLSFSMVIHVTPGTPAVSERAEKPNVQHRQVDRPPRESTDYAINLISYRRIPTVADIANLPIAESQRVFYTKVIVDGTPWYRLRLGIYATGDDAQVALTKLKADYPGAWIDRVDPASESVDLTPAARSASNISPVAPVTSTDQAATTGLEAIQATETERVTSEVDTLMEEARQTMVAGDRSRAIQIYTKVLQLPAHPLQEQAQEYLALAREKNGQTAHAKAEYQRYLSLYPEGEGAARVSQRLAALVAGDRQLAGDSTTASTQSRNARRNASNWRLQTFASQYYRRDVNQQNDQDEIVSQSALYSDINFDARRRGTRFDFSTRISAGYRNDFLDDQFGSGNSTRISYAYADLSDAATGLRGRIGRQSRNSGGVLGRFDGLNLGYQISERLLLNAVVGKPAYSANDGVDSERTFYGASIEFGPLWDGLELGAFMINQTIDGIQDRQAIGGEFRYFGSDKSLWGLVDYDTSFSELGSAFLQGSWRLSSRLTLNGSLDRRHSPFLSAGNAIIGQPVQDFSELAVIFSEDELRQLGLDRSPLSTTYTLGASYSLSPRWQISTDANQTRVDATPDSGGIFGTPAYTYRYFATNLIASSLFKEGDVSILGLRHSDSGNSKVLSLTLDSRFPFGRTWRLNPRLRVDRRERLTDIDYEWIYTPGLRLQYRRKQSFRIELDVGKQFTQRESLNVNMDRESYYINFGYQLFF